VAVTVDGYTLAEAQTALADWKAAITGLATSKSYTIGTRTLERVDLAEARQMVGYFAGLVDKLSNGIGAGVRVVRVVPRDL
jgi:hypothetical protein